MFRILCVTYSDRKDYNEVELQSLVHMSMVKRSFRMDLTEYDWFHRKRTMNKFVLLVLCMLRDLDSLHWFYHVDLMDDLLECLLNFR